MESEKVKEIKKALENCTNYYGTDCYHCTYLEKGCNIKLMETSLTLINELESENERLQEQNGALSCDLDYINEKLTNAENEVDDYKDRITELEKENARLANSITCQVILPDDKLEEIKKECLEKVELAKGELLKQFAEKVAKRLINIKGIKEILDEALKEFINTNKGDEER